MASRLRGSAGIGLAAIAAAMLVMAGLFAAPARAQELDGIVVDLAVDVEQGECGEGDCPDDERPVTFDARLEIDPDSADNLGLTAGEVDEVDDALAGVDLADDLIDIEVEYPDGGTQDLEDEETICLQPGEFDVAAVVADEADLEAAVVEALNEVDEGMDLEPNDVAIEDFDDTFTVDECDDNGDGADHGHGHLDDRDQENVCNNVVNIILEDVQNPDVDNTQNGVDDDGTDDGDVSDEQVVDVAQELNVSLEIVQQCIQQNAGRDANINSNNDDDNINDDFIDDNNNNDDDDDFIDDNNNNDDFIDDGDDLLADDEDFNVQDDGRGQVLAGTYPNQNLPNTGGISPAAVLAGLGFALLIAGLSAGHAVARRRS